MISDDRKQQIKMWLETPNKGVWCPFDDTKEDGKFCKKLFPKIPKLYCDNPELCEYGCPCYCHAYGEEKVVEKCKIILQ